MSKFLDCYYRVSTKGQKDEGHSLESQIQLSKIVAKQLGLEIREHNEFAKSSTIKGVTRDKFEEIKTLIEQDKIKNLWVVEQERLFRKPSDAFFFKEYYLDEFKVTLYSGENPQPQQFGSEFDNEMFQFRALISGFESKKIRRRSIRGKRHLLDNYSNEKSIYLGGTPTFGYDNKDKTWVINPEESKWIKWMFKSYADGLSSLNIKKELDLNNIKPRRTRSGLWNVGTIQNMLGNESFTGIKRFYDKELKKEWVYKIPQIINASLYQKVQKQIINNQKSFENNKKYHYLLDRLLYCYCESRMGSKTKVRPLPYGKTQKYYCTRNNKKSVGRSHNDCLNSKSLNVLKTETEITNIVKEVAKNSVKLKEMFKNDVLNTKNENEIEITGDKKRLEKKVKTLQKKIEETIQSISQIEFEKLLGKKDERITNNILKLLEQEKEFLEKEYKKTFIEIEETDSRKEWLNWLGKYGETLDYKTSSQQKKKEFISGLVKKIIVKPEYGTNRDGNQIQVGHTFEILFKMNIVNDKLIYKDGNNKTKGYEISRGKNKTKTPVLDVSNTVGKRKKKLLNQTNSKVIWELFNHSTVTDLAKLRG